MIRLHLIRGKKLDDFHLYWAAQLNDTHPSIAVAELMRPIDTSDLSWAKPYIDEARASLARGEGIPADQVFVEIDARLKQRGA